MFWAGKNTPENKEHFLPYGKEYETVPAVLRGNFHKGLSPREIHKENKGKGEGKNWWYCSIRERGVRSRQNTSDM
jgi:hypothetical protein